MKKIKQQSAKSKVGKDNVTIKCSDKPSFSFEHLTSNKRYNFDYFGKEKQAMILAKAVVYDRLQDISRQSWLYWNGQSKYNGTEAIKAKAIHFSPCGYDLSDDEKVIVFRFSYDSNDCRIIGLKKSPCSTYYIIGFDFDHSAYDHGS